MTPNKLAKEYFDMGFGRNLVIKDFARSLPEFLLLLKSSTYKKVFKAMGYDINKIPESAIEIDKGREGNWNDYVSDYGGADGKGIKVKRGDNWYEFRLLTWKLQK